MGQTTAHDEDPLLTELQHAKDKIASMKTNSGRKRKSSSATSMSSKVKDEDKDKDEDLGAKKAKPARKSASLFTTLVLPFLLIVTPLSRRLK